MFNTPIVNPILPGFNPDPNIIKVENTYYIIVSSFEWLPGIRVYSSEDLVNWKHKTDILTDQVNLRGNPENCSIWAPQISFHNGLFYLLYTNVRSTRRPFKDTHNYLMTASAIEGPWSLPIYLNSSGFDPSLFHDDDGRKWIVNEIWDHRLKTPNKSGGIILQEFDSDKAKLVGPRYKIFDGTELAKTEAPHIYKHDDFYYLLTAEGGTEKGHSVTICRAKEIAGPYELDPNYPMMTASDKPDSILQCTGHGSLVQGVGDRWYMVYLCTRPLNQTIDILGRETAIQEVCWTEDGWLSLVENDKRPAYNTHIVTTSKIKQVKNTNFYDDFDGQLLKEWNSLRILVSESWCDLKSKPGYLRLKSGESLQSLFEHHILAIRQKDFVFKATTKMSYHPTSYNQMAGLLLYLNDRNFLYLCVTYDDELGQILTIMSSENESSNKQVVHEQVDGNEIELKVEVEKTEGQFYYREKEKTAWKKIGSVKDLSFLAGGYTGNFVGIAVHDLDVFEGSVAEFSYFNYQGLD